MGRRPIKQGAIPRFRKRVRGQKTYYYYDHGINARGQRKEESLGSDYGLAIKRWAELENAVNLPPPARILFCWVADQYMASVAVRKAPQTLAGNRKEVAKIKEFFGDPPAPLESIQPVNIGEYLRWRTKDGMGYTRANREKALISHIWNFARERGYTALSNPCVGVKGFREKGRDAYVEDDQFNAIWKAADPCLRDAMDLAYLTGQRPSDVLSLDESSVKDAHLFLTQGKTKKKLRVSLSAELTALIARIRARKRTYKIYSTNLIVNEKGRPISVAAMCRRWRKACLAAGIEGLQFRDLRAKAGTKPSQREMSGKPKSNWGMSRL